MAEFLLEIGVEEMPAGWLAGLTEQMRERFLDLARREHLMPEVVEAASTPRRLAVTGHVPPRQPDREDMVWGPAEKIAKDAGGHWTKAAEGFKEGRRPRRSAGVRGQGVGNVSPSHQAHARP
jgi:glycyl-tRNA synthetase beta chain